MSFHEPHKKHPFTERIEQEWSSLKTNIVVEWESLRRQINDPTNWNNTIRKESNEVADYYLSAEQREQLKYKKRFERWWYKMFWVFCAIFEKLSTERRVLSVIGVVLIVLSDSNSLYPITGGLFLVVVIMLELKDKLVAHDELAAGRKIQESLMPERMPNVNGWKLWLYTRSANEVCGDLIDFLKLDSGRFGIAIADVAGKGLHAALITAKLQATLRALAREIDSLPELIGKINSIVHRDSPAKIFSSMLYAECSEENGTIAFVNAGHFPALIKRNSIVEETAKGETALGLSSTMKFTEHTVTLNSGDLFILYSDGLTEAKSESGDFFGKERFVELLKSANGTPEQIGSTILQSLDRFVGSSAPSDDLSLIILQRM